MNDLKYTKRAASQYARQYGKTAFVVEDSHEYFVADNQSYRKHFQGYPVFAVFKPTLRQRLKAVFGKLLP